jgi:hypothetical protein
MWLLTKAVKKSGSFAFYKGGGGKPHQRNRQISQKRSIKEVPRTVCTSTVVVSPGPLSPTLSTSAAIRTPKNTGEDHDDPELADEGDIQVEHSSD